MKRIFVNLITCTLAPFFATEMLHILYSCILIITAIVITNISFFFLLLLKTIRCLSFLQAAHAYSGSSSGPVAAAMKACDPTGPLLVHVMKLYSAPDGATFHALARVYSGTLKKGHRVRVLGEAYTLDDEEDAADRDVLGLALPEVLGLAWFGFDLVT